MATVLELTVVVVPFTVRFPETITLPLAVRVVAVISSEVRVPSTETLLKVTLELVATACPIATETVLPDTLVATPVPPAIVRVSPPATAFVVPLSASRSKEVDIAPVDTAVTRPLALTVTIGIAVVEPKLPTLELTVARVLAPVTLAVPSKFPEVHVTSPVIEAVRAVAHLVAVAASATAMSAEPLNDVPPIVRAVASIVAEPARPEVF